MFDAIYFLHIIVDIKCVLNTINHCIRIKTCALITATEIHYAFDGRLVSLLQEQHVSEKWFSSEEDEAVPVESGLFCQSGILPLIY